MHKVLRQFFQFGLPHVGICRHMARDVIFASEKHQGMGIIHPMVTQGLLKLVMLYDQSNTMTSKLIIISMSSTSVECGLGGNFLLQSYARFYKILEGRCITTRWDFLDDHQIRLLRQS